MAQLQPVVRVGPVPGLLGGVLDVGWLLVAGALCEGVGEGVRLSRGVLGVTGAVGWVVGPQGVYVVGGAVYRAAGGDTKTFTTEVTTTVGVGVGLGLTVTVLVGTGSGATSRANCTGGVTTGR